MKTRYAAISVAAFSITLGNAKFAQATIGLPDNESCSQNGNSSCLIITQNGNGGAIQGISTTTTVGIPAIYGLSDTSAIGVAGRSISGNGINGATAGVWPSAGVYGTSTATSGYPMGVVGIADNGNGTGVYGEGPLVGVQGYSLTAANGVGVSGVSGGTGGHAIDAICNSSCVGSGYAGYFHGNVFATGTYGGSDVRLKKDISDSKYGLADVMKMRPVTFKWKEGDDQTQIGLLAQDIQKLVPELVRAGDQGMLGINYNGIGPVLIKAIQEQQKMIESQQAQITRLERGGHLGSRVSDWVPAGLGLIGLGFIPIGLAASRRRRGTDI